MILNALDEVLFWNDIEILKRFIKESTQKYYPQDYKSFYELKDIFLKQHISTKETFINRLKYYETNGSPIWVSGRNQLSDDIDLDMMIKTISVSSQIANGQKKAEKGRLVIRCLKPEKVLWYSQFARYGFSDEDTIEWLKRVRLYASAEQIKSIVIDNGLICIEEIFDERLGHILIFEK